MVASGILVCISCCIGRLCNSMNCIIVFMLLFDVVIYLDNVNCGAVYLH